MFQGKTVVITGAGRGIGRALALSFAAQGANIVVHYGQSRQDAEEVMRQIVLPGGQAVLVQADVRVSDEVHRLVEQAQTTFGPIDVWINNAGASANSAESQELSEIERFERMVAVDVMGTWRCCRAAIPAMNTGSCILTLGWDHAFDGAAGFVNQMYAVSKGGVIAMTRCLARELAPAIRVNCIAPGWVENAWAQSRSETFQQRVAQSIPMKRWGTPEDIVSAALFLASPAASFITGQILIVDGGEVMR